MLEASVSNGETQRQEISGEHHKKGRGGDNGLETDRLKQTIQDKRGERMLWPLVNEPQRIGHIHPPENSTHGTECDQS
jgi:hypothetical protein